MLWKPVSSLSRETLTEAPGAASISDLSNFSSLAVILTSTGPLAVGDAAAVGDAGAVVALATGEFAVVDVEYTVGEVPAGWLWIVGVVDDLLLPPHAAASGTAATNAMASRAFHPGRCARTLIIETPSSVLCVCRRGVPRGFRLSSYGLILRRYVKTREQ